MNWPVESKRRAIMTRVVIVLIISLLVTTGNSGNVRSKKSEIISTVPRELDLQKLNDIFRQFQAEKMLTKLQIYMHKWLLDNRHVEIPFLF